MASRGLKSWVEKLKAQSLPVMGGVVGELNKITGSDDSDVNQLSELILRDPALTSHVLKIANSVQYNYTRIKINTVSRAIVQLGLKGVRAICISSLVMESFLKEQPKERVLELIAQGFHAATQARNLLDKSESDVAEEVFVAALLFNLGEMAFWSIEDLAGENAGLISDSAKERKAAMEKVLGTSFKAITRELAKEWRLGETLEKALASQPPELSKVKAVALGERLSRASLYGWESPQLRKVLLEVAEFCGISLEDALAKVREGGDQAAEMALSYGVPEACPLIPSSFEDFLFNPATASNKILRADAGLQLNVLRDLSNAATEGIDVNALFQMVLEGMHRGIGLERVCVAMLKGQHLVAKYLVGEGTEHWRDRFVVDAGPFADNIFAQTLVKGGSHWFNQAFIESHKHLYTPDFVTSIGRFPCFVHAIEIDGHRRAIFYADRWNLGGRLDESQFESFKHFAVQAELTLGQLSRATRARAAAAAAKNVIRPKGNIIRR